MLSLLQVHMQLWRANRLIGFWLVLWPSLWALALAHPSLSHFGWEDLFYTLLFVTGAFFIRSAGCIINDIFDRKIDIHVRRTKNRPLASQTLNIFQACQSLLIALLGGLLTWLFLPVPVQLLALWALPLIGIYPLMKRMTYWPQLFLGFTINWGVLMGWRIYAELDHVALLLYVACIFWTLAYDTIYALQDRADDCQIGIKSSALFLGRHVKIFSLFSMAVFVLCYLMVLWAQESRALLPSLSLCILALYDLIKLDLSETQRCYAYFIRQGIFGGALWGALLISVFL